MVVFLTAVCAGLTWLLAPQVARQVDQLVDVFPQTLNRFTAVLRQYEWGAWLLDGASDGANGDSGALTSGVGLVSGVFSSSIAAVVNFVLVLVIGLYLAAEARMYQRGLLRMAPPAKARAGGRIAGRFRRCEAGC